MEDVKIFYDQKGNPEFVQVSYKDYQQMIEHAKETVELKKTINKVNDLIRVFV